MSLSTLELASTSALALLASSADANPGHSSAGEDLAPHRPALNLRWETKRTASDVLTELLDVDGIRVVAERRIWDRPDTLALRHDFASNTPVYLHCTAGIDRRQSAAGVMAEVGASWRLTSQLNVETDLRWIGVSRDARPVRTDAALVGGNPVALTLSLVWRGK